MKLSSSIVSFALLGVISFIVWGCGGWFAHNNDRRQQQQAQIDTVGQVEKIGKTTALLPLDSLIVRIDSSYIHEDFGPYLISGRHFYFDTSAAKRSARPDLNEETAFSNPEFKHFFGITDDYTITFQRSVTGDYVYTTFYKGVGFERINMVRVHRDKGRIGKVYVTYLTPVNDPDEAKISAEQALELALAKRKPELREPTVKMVYRYVGPNLEAKLYYKVNIDDWIIRIDAITGEVGNGYYLSAPEYLQSPCTPIDDEPNYPVELWYDNGLPHFGVSSQDKQIRLHFCDFGTCELYQLGQDNSDNRITAYCAAETDLSATTDTRRDHIWAANNLEITPLITLVYNNPNDAPDNNSITNGIASIQISNPNNTPTTYTYNGSLSGTWFGEGNTGNTVLTNLGAGIFPINISNGSCSYPEAIAIGTDNAFMVTATITPATCYEYGNIVLNMPDFTNAIVKVYGPINTDPFNGVNANNYGTSAIFDIANKLNGGQKLPPGNYAIIVAKNDQYTALNVRIAFPNCNDEIKALQSAYWAIEHTHHFLSDPTNLIYDNNPPSATPNAVDFSLSSTTNGINPLTMVKPLIKISLLRGEELNAVTNLTALVLNNQFRIRLPMLYFDQPPPPNPPIPPKPIVCLDVLGHEYSHAINARGLSLTCDDMPTESAALVESFCDIMGVLVQSSVKQLDWEIGESVGIIRNLSNPKTYNRPTTYGGQYWHTGTGANPANRYYNSQILSYWFYLLSQGGSGTVDAGNAAQGNYPPACAARSIPTGTTFDVTSIGMGPASKIMLEVLTNNNFGMAEPSNQNYAGMSKATLRAAETLYGACSTEVLAVREAWRAVGIDAWSMLAVPQESADCDLTAPYLKQVKVINSSGTVKYEKKWAINSGTGQLCLVDVSGPPTNLIITAGQTIQIEVKSNEPLSAFNFEGFKKTDGTLITSNYTTTITATDAPTNKEWRISLQATAPIGFGNSGEDVSLVFSGKDNANHDLLPMHSIAPDPCFNFNNLPQRSDTNNDFQPTLPTPDSRDEKHRLHIIGCTAPTLTPTPALNTANGSINITNAEPGGTYLWSNGATTQNLSNVAAGAYTVTVTGVNGCSSSATALVSNFFDVRRKCDTNIVIADPIPEICPGSTIILRVYLPISNITINFGNAHHEILSGPSDPYQEFALTWFTRGLSTITVNGESRSFWIRETTECIDDWICTDLSCSNVANVYVYYRNYDTGVVMVAPMVVARNNNVLPMTLRTTIKDINGDTLVNDTFVFNQLISGFYSLPLAGMAYTIPSTEFNQLTVTTTWEDGSGCSVTDASGKTDIISYPDGPPPVFDSAASINTCEGTIFCIPYSVALPDADIRVGLKRDTPLAWTFTHNITQTGSTATGTFCYTPNASDVGTHAVTLYAYDFLGGGLAEQTYTISINCCFPPTLSFTAQEIIPAQKGCNGQVWQSGSVAIMPNATQYSGSCKPPFTVNGTANPTQPVWADGMNYYEVNYQGQTQTVAVNIPAIEPGQTGNEIALYVGAEVTPATRYCYGGDKGGDCGCWVNECDGSISLSTIQGGSGNYSYRWSDNCECSQYATDSPNYDPCCAVHTNLCHGCYTVTISDNETGCQTTRTYNVGVQVNGQTYYSICNTDPNSTVVNNTAGQTFTMATLDPKLQIYPSAFDVLTNVKYEVKEDSYVTIRVYNLQGIPIETIVDETFTPKGEYILTGEGNDYSNGLYIFVLETCEKSVGKIGVKY